TAPAMLPHTIELWTRTSNGTAAGESIDINTTDGALSLAFMPQSGQTATFRWSTASGSQAADLPVPASPGMHDVDLTWTRDTVTLWADGQAYSSASPPGGINPAPTDDGAPGGFWPTAGSVSVTAQYEALDELAFYSAVLSGSQIASHYSASQAPYNAAP